MAMMATSSMTSTLNIPTADDNMEISSDAGRADQDIDIDFMDSEHGDQDVDWMLQDNTLENGHLPAPEEQGAHNDDLMYDDADEITYAEEPMQHDIADQQGAEIEATEFELDYQQHPATEETLYDAAEEDQQEMGDGVAKQEEETLVDFGTYPENGEPSSTQDLASNQDDAGPVAMKDISAVQANNSPQQDLASANRSDIRQAQSHEELLTEDIQSADFASGVEKNDEQEDPSEPPQEQNHETQATSRKSSPSLRSPMQPNVHAEDHQAEPVNSDEEAAGAHVAANAEQLPPSSDAPDAAAVKQVNAATDAVRHITVLYGSDQFPLFASSEDDDPNSYLLKDPVVASSTLVDFFSACRSVLDDDLTDAFQLEIRLDQLGLTIAEDSVHCHDTSLSQMVEVYVDLMRNDGFETPDPFVLQLNITNRFSAQLTSLFKAASEKKGLSQLDLDIDHSFPVTEEQESSEEEHEGETQEPEVEELDQISTAPGVMTHDPADQDSYEAIAGTAIQDEGSSTYVPEKNLDEVDDLEDRDGNDETHLEESADQSEPGIGLAVQEEPEVYIQPEYETEVKEEPAEDVEQGEESSSGSSTVHGETQPEPTRGYTPPSKEEEWLIDYSNEDDDNDEAFETLRDNDDHSTGPQAADEVQGDDQGAPNPVEHSAAGGTHEEFVENEIGSYDDTTYDANTFDQEFGVVDFEYHEDSHDSHQLEQIDQQWIFDDTQQDTDSTLVQASGTFQVPDTSEEDEDEITFNDDEFTVDDAETQDTTAQEHTSNSPLGKRSREDDGEGLLDGSDQESKRLKAA